MKGVRDLLELRRRLTVRTTTSTPFSTFPRPIKLAMDVAKLVVSSVVVLERRMC